MRDRYDLSSLRFVIHGAAPTPVHEKQRDDRVVGADRFTSTTPRPKAAATTSSRRRSGCANRAPSAGRRRRKRTRILDDDGNEVAQGQSGTIYFRAPDVGRFEYFKAPEKTSQSYRGDWFTLGDMGYLDADGYLFLNGRNAETIISGGVNIYPQEIDSELLKHPAVRRRLHRRRAERGVGRRSEERRAAARRVTSATPRLAAGSDRVRAFAAAGIQNAAVDRFCQRLTAAAERQDPTPARARALLGRSRPADLSVSAVPVAADQFDERLPHLPRRTGQCAAFVGESRSTVRVMPSATCVARRFQCSNPSRARSTGDRTCSSAFSVSRWSVKKMRICSLWISPICDSASSTPPTFSIVSSVAMNSAADRSPLRRFATFPSSSARDRRPSQRRTSRSSGPGLRSEIRSTRTFLGVGPRTAGSLADAIRCGHCAIVGERGHP